MNGILFDLNKKVISLLMRLIANLLNKNKWPGEYIQSIDKKNNNNNWIEQRYLETNQLFIPQQF